MTDSTAHRRRDFVKEYARKAHNAEVLTAPVYVGHKCMMVDGTTSQRAPDTQAKIDRNIGIYTARFEQGRDIFTGELLPEKNECL